jgi:Integrase
MPRHTRRLTHTEVDRSKPQEKEYTLQDGDGLYLIVRPNGSKVWRFNYYRPVVTPKKRALLSFGSYPDVSLATARTKRDEARALVSDGIDPQNRQKQKIEAAQVEAQSIFSVVARNWWDLKKTSVSADHAFDIWRSIERDLLPIIGDTPIQELKPRTLIQALEPVKQRGSLETLRRIIQRLNEIMIYAINSGLTDINPASGISYVFEKPKKEHQPSIRPERLPELMTALSNANVTLQTRCLIMWQLLTIVRPVEAVSARWDEIDITSCRWVVPAEIMKMKREHIVPLCKQAMSILDLLRPITGHREFVFPSIKDPTKPMNSQTVNAALKRMGFKGELVSHGMRSIASTAMNEAEFNPDVIEAALAHLEKDEVRRAYNRSVYIDQRIDLMQWWGDFVERSSPPTRLFG